MLHLGNQMPLKLAEKQVSHTAADTQASTKHGVVMSV